MSETTTACRTIVVGTDGSGSPFAVQGSPVEVLLDVTRRSRCDVVVVQTAH